MKKTSTKVINEVSLPECESIRHCLPYLLDAFLEFRGLDSPQKCLLFPKSEKTYSFKQGNNFTAQEVVSLKLLICVYSLEISHYINPGTKLPLSVLMLLTWIFHLCPRDDDHHTFPTFKKWDAFLWIRATPSRGDLIGQRRRKVYLLPFLEWGSF